MFLFDPPEGSPLATSVPCIVELSVGGGTEVRHYGPFASLNDARDWCAKQMPSHFSVIPLRTIHKDRPNNDDWYFTNYGDIESIIDDFYPIDEYKKWAESQ